MSWFVETQLQQDRLAMPKTELGQLVSVDITDGWSDEPRDFTPWLAQNMDRLSESIGILLSDPQTEVRIDQSGAERFCADIVAVTPDGEAVLIENQFGSSDHGHLGQILTYLAGIEAKIVIWIAPWFRESHLSAIRWLNSHTHDEYSFFAVQLRLVRIGDSMMAPLFDVLERPNQWERRLLEKQREIAAPQVNEKREFWDAYVGEYPHAVSDMGGGGRGSTRWREVPNSGLFVARWFVGEGVGIFVRGGRGQGNDAFHGLPKPVRQRLAKRLGAGSDDEDYPLYKWWPGTITGKKDWKRAIDWLETQTQTYVNAIEEELGVIA